MWHSHTIKYYWAIKRNEVLTQATTWMNLENMLSKRSKSHKIHIICFHLHEMSRKSKYIEMDRRLVICSAAELEGEVRSDC